MALILNLLIPGTGLIVRGRHWLGFAIALLFAFSLNVAIAGWLVAPLAIPPAYTWAGTLIAGATWVLAQVSLFRVSASAVAE